MGINLSIQKLKEQIAKDINESKLPPGITLMIFNEFVGQLQKLNNEAITLEKQAVLEKRIKGQKIKK